MKIALVFLLAGVLGLAVLPSLQATPIQSSVDIPGMTINRFSNAVLIGGGNIQTLARKDSDRGIVDETYLFGSTVGGLLQSFGEALNIASINCFGHTLATERNNGLVSPLLGNTRGNNVGCIYLFGRTNGNLLPYGEGVGHSYLLGIATGDLAQSSNHFSDTAAIDGNNALVNALKLGARRGNSGQIHLFGAINGKLLQVLNDPTPMAGDLVGSLLSVTGNLNPRFNQPIGVTGDQFRTTPTSAPAPRTLVLVAVGLACLVILHHIQCHRRRCKPKTLRTHPLD